MKVATKYVEVECIEFDGRNHTAVRDWCWEQAKAHNVSPWNDVPADQTQWFVSRRDTKVSAEMWKALVPHFNEEDHRDIIAVVFDRLHETWVGVKAGQFIICGLEGEFYPCDPKTLWAKYEKVPDGPLPQGTTCDIGQRIKCGKPAVGVFAIAALRPNVYEDADYDTKGVVMVCEGHFNMPICDW